MKKTTVLIVVFLAVAVAGAAFAGDMGKHDPNVPMVFDSEQPIGAKATCPVLKDTFTITEKTQHSEIDGKHVYFCCDWCKPQFDADPAKYLPKK